LHREKVAPAELFQGVLEETADKAAARNLKIDCAIDPDLPQVLVDRQRIGFTVADDGPGISPEYQQRIFDRFFRVPGQTRSGAGLGLSIAREIAVAHGGRISVRSTPGKDATFYLELKAIDGEA
jgi:signal transduction histidine kinase